jgi:hypothetical protein
MGKRRAESLDHKKSGIDLFLKLRIESAICRWKDLNEGYKFGSDLVAIRPGSQEL